MTSDDLTEEVEQLREDFSDYSKTVEEYIEKRPERNRIARVERIQIVTALAVVTAYLSLLTSQTVQFQGSPLTCFGESGFHCALSSQAGYAGAFLTLKLGIMSIRPIYEEEYEWIVDLDEYWLTATHLALIPGSLIAGIGVFIAPSFGFPFFTAIYITLEILLVFTIGRRYARAYKKEMARVYSSTTNETVSVTRGPSGDTTSLQIENKDNKSLKEGSVQFLVNAPDGVNVNLDSQAYLVGDDAWTYAHTLPPETPQRVPVHIQLDSEKGELSRETIEIDIEICGEVKQTQKLDVFG